MLQVYAFVQVFINIQAYLNGCVDPDGLKKAVDLLFGFALGNNGLALLPRVRPKSKSTALFKLSGSTQPFNLSYYFIQPYVV